MDGQRWLGALLRCCAPIALLAASLPLTPTHAREVAITFDDLPVFGMFASAADGGAVTAQLLAAIKRNRWKATGSVNVPGYTVAPVTIENSARQLAAYGF